MDFDLEAKSIGFFRLGDRLDVSFKRVIALGYSITVDKGIVDSFCIHFNPITEDEHVFGDRIICGERILNLCGTTSPEDIKDIFGEPSKVCDDGVSHNMCYLEDNYQYEFKWTWLNESEKQLDSWVVAIL